MVEILACVSVGMVLGAALNVLNAERVEDKVSQEITSDPWGGEGEIVREMCGSRGGWVRDGSVPGAIDIKCFEGDASTSE
jgi:hypothetical protein